MHILIVYNVKVRELSADNYFMPDVVSGDEKKTAKDAV